MSFPPPLLGRHLLPILANDLNTADTVPGGGREIGHALPVVELRSQNPGA